MRQLSLFWKLYLSYVLVIVLALLMVVVGSYAVGVFRESFLAQPVATLTMCDRAFLARYVTSRCVCH
jgi:hypothetical protein